MFIAMNRFQVIRGEEEAFEQVWLNRDVHLDGVPGFLEFHLLRGPEQEDHILYSSHTVWASKADFEAWTKSEAFAKGHAKRHPGMFAGHPVLEQYEVFETTFKAK